MKQHVPIASIMSTNVVKLNLSDDLTKAEVLFKKHHIRHIPVVEGDRIIGMLSLTDLLRISFVDAVDDDDSDVDTTVYNIFTIEQVMAKKLVTVSPQTTIEQVMAKKLVTVSPQTTIKETAQILAAREFHALPVCDGDLLVGIVTTTDLIRYLIDQY